MLCIRCIGERIFSCEPFVGFVYMLLLKLICLAMGGQQ
jgi:hypothetical protein